MDAAGGPESAGGEKETAAAGEGDGAAGDDEILAAAMEAFERGAGTAGMEGGGPEAETAGGSAGTTDPARTGGAPGRTGTIGADSGGSVGRGTGAAAPTAGTGSAVTDAERVAILRGRLDESLAEFDGVLLDQRAVIGAGAADPMAGVDDEYGYGGGAAWGEESGGSAPPLLTAEAGAAGTGSGGGAMPAMPRRDRAGDYEQVAAAAPVPADIPRGDADDVVARQLREAAMKEPDPVLREKLWNEYRKYKGLPVKE
jgi:hypothetical protein